MKAFDRIFVLVLDGFGVGAQADAPDFGDQGANTLASVLKEKSASHFPELSSLGLFELLGKSPPTPLRKGAAFTRMKEISAGKDTTTGHWEMMGLPVQQAFDTFPQGFPKELMEILRKETGLDFIGNRTASGTQIIEELGEQHIQTGSPIIYTSADSVLQLACHEKHFGLDRLYKLCEQIRKLLNESRFSVGRVIARPFVGENSKDFQRTSRRRDFSLNPFGETCLTRLRESGVSVTGLGKIPSIYNHQGFSREVKSESDRQGMQESLNLLRQTHEPGLIFANFNDLDMLYGHRRKSMGYAEHLMEIDHFLPKLIAELKNDDLFIVTSDHGNDPSFKGSDHTREFVPLLTFSKAWETEVAQRLPERQTFADIGQSILKNFGVPKLQHGESFL